MSRGELHFSLSSCFYFRYYQFPRWWNSERSISSKKGLPLDRIAQISIWISLAKSRLSNKQNAFSDKYWFPLLSRLQSHWLWCNQIWQTLSSSNAESYCMSQALIGTGGPPVHKFSCLHLSPLIHSIFIIPASGAAAAAGQAGWQPGGGTFNSSLGHCRISVIVACRMWHLVTFLEI